ncbi:hypothetical protein EG329_008701 [Mollisiaceae sp. DMI_Dod_QoI]|nr:hypothetical protein EG329_008701 [Helotiales sp. DMI_Dod_QoI]
MPDMIEFFQEVASIDNQQLHIKICIASRPHPLIIAAFCTCHGFKLQDRNDNGIKSYIDRRLMITRQSQYNPGVSDNHLKIFAEWIRKRACGVFLWARFAVDELLLGLADGDKETKIWTRLQALPDELEEIYARIVNRIVQASGNPEETSIMFQIAPFPLRSLTPQEFFTALQLSLGQPLISAPFSSTAFESRLRAKTGGLLEVVQGNVTDTSSRVKLIHETVRAYLDGRHREFGLSLDLEHVFIPKEDAQVQCHDPTSTQTPSQHKDRIFLAAHDNDQIKSKRGDALDPSGLQVPTQHADVSLSAQLPGSLQPSLNARTFFKSSSSWASHPVPGIDETNVEYSVAKGHSIGIPTALIDQQIQRTERLVACIRCTMIKIPVCILTLNMLLAKQGTKV